VDVAIATTQHGCIPFPIHDVWVHLEEDRQPRRFVGQVGYFVVTGSLVVSFRDEEEPIGRCGNFQARVAGLDQGLA